MAASKTGRGDGALVQKWTPLLVQHRIPLLRRRAGRHDLQGEEGCSVPPVGSTALQRGSLPRSATAPVNA